MNVTIVKDRCRVVCRSAKELRVISYDEAYGEGCDLIVVSDNERIYVIECKESLKSATSLNKVVQQIEKCIDFVKKSLGRHTVQKIYIKERGKRVYSQFVDYLKKRGIEVHESVFELRAPRRT